MGYAQEPQRYRLERCRPYRVRYRHPHVHLDFRGRYVQYRPAGMESLVACPLRQFRDDGAQHPDQQILFCRCAVGGAVAMAEPALRALAQNIEHPVLRCRRLCLSYNRRRKLLGFRRAPGILLAAMGAAAYRHFPLAYRGLRVPDEAKTALSSGNTDYAGRQAAAHRFPGGGGDLLFPGVLSSGALRILVLPDLQETDRGRSFERGDRYHVSHNQDPR